MIPIEQCYNPLFIKQPVMQTFDLMIDIIFFCDIILMFFTSVINFRGRESHDSKLISILYTSQLRFYTDAFSMLAVGPIVELNNYFAIFGLLKMLRVFRLGKMIATTNLDKNYKAVLNITKIIFYLVLYVHMVGSFWWLTISLGYPELYYANTDKKLYIHSTITDFDSPISQDNIFQEIDPITGNKRNKPFENPNQEVMFGNPPTFDQQYPNDMTQYNDRSSFYGVNSFWYAPLDWVNFPDQELFTAGMSLSKRFWLNLYYGVLILGANEIGPVNPLEMIGCTIFLVISALLNAILFGQIADLVGNLSAKSTAIQEQLDQANTVMESIELQDEIQEEIRMFFNKTQATKEAQVEFSDFLELISPSLQLKIYDTIYRQMMKKNGVIIKILGNTK